MAVCFPNDTYLSFATKGFDENFNPILVNNPDPKTVTGGPQGKFKPHIIGKGSAPHFATSIFGHNPPIDRPVGRNPASGCGNCQSVWDVGCQIGKLSCELQAAGGKDLGAIGKYLPLIAIGGGVLLLLVVLKR